MITLNTAIPLLLIACITLIVIRAIQIKAESNRRAEEKANNPDVINSLITFAPNAIFIQGNLELYEWCEHEIWHREDATETELRISLEVLDQAEIDTLELQIRENTEEEFEIDDVNYIIIYK